MTKQDLLAQVQERIRLHHQLKVWMKYLFGLSVLFPVLTTWIYMLQMWLWIALLLVSIVIWAAFLVVGYAVWKSSRQIEAQILTLENHS